MSPLPLPTHNSKIQVSGIATISYLSLVVGLGKCWTINLACNTIKILTLGITRANSKLASGQVAPKDGLHLSVEPNWGVKELCILRVVLIELHIGLEKKTGKTED